MASSTGSTIVAKANATSAVWTYFGFEADEKGKARIVSEAICCLCNARVKARALGGATLAIFFRILKCITLSSMQRPRKLEKNEDPAFVRLLYHQDSLQSLMHYKRAPSTSVAARSGRNSRIVLHYA